MPVYEFMAADGSGVREEYFPAPLAPSIGERIVMDGVEFVRVGSLPSVPVMFDSKNMDAGEIAMALDHKRDLESNPDRFEWKEKGPLEFRPNPAKTVY